MKKLEIILKSLCIAFILISCSNVATDKDVIGIVEDSKYTISADTVVLKKEMASHVTQKPDTLSLDKISIIKSTTTGDRQEDFYMLVLQDFKRKLKVARWLERKGDSFYFYKTASMDTMEENEIFYNTIISCRAADKDCFPHVAIVEDQKVWTASKTLGCVKSAECIFAKTLIFDEPEIKK
ncbi:MAG: hypothetical protein EOO45_21835 [Flavobacterium sp.]|nr:MAG: hypothetical protein EOO45_21835 [Flavobacterium sp.]